MLSVKETELIGHYNSNVNYASFDWKVIQEAAKKLKINLNIRNVLDLGCGVGKQLDHFTGSTGVDYAEKRIKIARENDTVGNKYLCASVYKYLNNLLRHHYGGLFRLILMFEFLEHLEHPDIVVEIARRYGPIFGAVPLNMPYIAHLQVFKTPEEVVKRFNVQCYVINKNIHDHMFFVIERL